jgi:hypothetical protein
VGFFCCKEDVLRFLVQSCADIVQTVQELSQTENTCLMENPNKVECSPGTSFMNLR